MLASLRTFIERSGMSHVMVAMPSVSTSYLIMVMVLYPLDDGGGAHAGADAERGEAGRQIAALHLVVKRAQDHGAGGAERMAHGDRAAVHVDLVVRHLEDLHVAQDDGGERL